MKKERYRFRGSGRREVVSSGGVRYTPLWFAVLSAVLLTGCEKVLLGIVSQQVGRGVFVPGLCFLLVQCQVVDDGCMFVHCWCKKSPV